MTRGDLPLFSPGDAKAAGMWYTLLTIQSGRKCFMPQKTGFHGQVSDSFRAALFLILSGGFQDAYTYCNRGRVFANAQTGNIVLMSTHLFEGQWGEAVKYLIPLAAFILGTVASEWMHIRLKGCHRLHWRQTVLLLEMGILLAVPFLPHGLDPLANGLVSFVCALQLQAFHKIRGHAYASTMCIGNMRSGTEALCTYLHTRDKAFLHKSLTYFAVIGVFAVGAGLGSYMTNRLGEGALWVCCGLLLVSFLMMFARETPEQTR